MSLIASSFDLTGSYFASCILELDTHKLRIQSVDPSSANSLSNSFSLERNTKVLSLTWGLFTNAKDARLESQYLAICLSNGSVLIYSPVQNEVISTLRSPSGSAAISFHHSRATNTAFSIDANGNINEWDLSSYTLLRSFKAPQLGLNSNEQISRLVTVMCNDRVHLLIASYSVILVDLQSLNEVIHTFPGHVSRIHTILPISDDLFITAAENDRFINVYSISKKDIEKVLVAQTNIASVSFGTHGSKRVLVAVTEDNVELFNDPLAVAQALNGSASNRFSKKKKTKSKSKSSDAVLAIVRPANNPTNEILKIEATFSLQDKIIFTWLENSRISFFDTLKWSDEEDYSLKGKIELIKAKPVIKLNDHSLHGHDYASSKQYNEGNAIVQTGDDFKDLENEESLAEQVSKLSSVPSLAAPKEKKKSRATTGTLTTVLTQAIKSNDHSLLETVLNNRDEDIIKNTIKKANTTYVIPLLNRISERIARNSSKQSILNIWIKWLFIIHGGFLNSYSNLTSNLGILHTTLHRRSMTLTRLLEVNGKIDMVLENMELKKLILKSSSTNEYGEQDEEENDSDVEYIEELEDNALDITEESEMDDDDDQMDDYIENDEDDLDSADLDEEDGEVADEDDQDYDEDNYSDEEVGTN